MRHLTFLSDEFSEHRTLVKTMQKGESMRRPNLNISPCGAMQQYIMLFKKREVERFESRTQTHMWVT